MRRPTLIQFLASFLLAACGPILPAPPTATPSSTPVVSGIPELLISGVYLSMQGVPGQGGGCVPNYGPLEIRVTVQNLSQTAAQNISVLEHSTGISLTIAELGAWQSIELIFPATSSTGSYNLEVDPENQIPEIDEQNNTSTYFAPTPTPPALCTATPTPAPSESTPITSLTPMLPTDTPSPTPVTSGVPELLISSVYLGMQGFPGTGCVPIYGPFEIRVTIQNLSETPAHNIAVVEHFTAITLTIEELDAWQSIELNFPATSSNGSYNVEVDPENLIPEIDEQNNVFSYSAPTPTPPALCTPTLTPGPQGS
jgi:subtilase family serine protease